VERIRIVTDRFRGETYNLPNQEPIEHRDFLPGMWLLLLRHDPENASTFFALVSDIPEVQPVPPRPLPEYVIDTDTFENCTRAAA
jgi:hypothetical protein